MQSPILFLCGLMCAMGSAFAQSAPVELAEAPTDSTSYTIMSAGGRHGAIKEWTAPDGTLMTRMNFVLRGMVTDTEEAIRLAADGSIADYRLRGSDHRGDVGETFSVSDGVARWTSPIDSGSAPYKPAAFYRAAGWGFRGDAVLAERLVANPAQEVVLLPGGRARIEPLANATVGEGAARQHLTAWAITGVDATPYAVWIDADGRFFAWIGGLSFIRSGYEDAQPVLEKIQDEALARQSPVLARTLATTPAGPVAFTDVRTFLNGNRFAEEQTVVVEHGKIVAVGPAASTPVPAGATVYAGASKTLVPGLWDAHKHVTDDYTGPSLLSLGVTSVRDPGSVVALTKARRARRAAGELLTPHVYASTLIDGKGPNTAQVAVVVTSQEETLAAVRQAKEDGQTGVKFYGSLEPSWVAPAAAQAHGLGLQVHGHLPVGMRPLDAIDAGYDEITHIFSLVMQAMPEEVWLHSRGMERVHGVARYTKDLDLDAEPMAKMIATMAARQIAVDPTLVVAENWFAAENGQISPAYAPFIGSLPPAVERESRQGGLEPAAPATRADYRASLAKLVALVGKLHRAGVSVVAGTDGSGLELVRELELYVEAGLTPAEALAAATVVPARLVGADGHTGTIAVGKDADLVLVEGDPSRRIGDLRQTRVVMMDGKLMDADRLRAAVGVSARPASGGGE